MTYAMRLALAAFLALGAQGCSKQEKPQDEQQREPRQEDAAAQPPGAARPVQPKPRIVELAAGEAHTCVRTDQGTVRCWGKGAHGRLGYGNTKTIGDDEPASAGGDVELGGKAVQITAGDEHTCALLQGGAVRCWGNGDSGRLGYGNTKTIGDDETPASAGDVPVGAAVRQIDAGGRHTCGLLESGHLRCWGEGQENRLGYGSWDNIGDDETPSVVGDVPLGSLAQQVALGYALACALLQSKAVRCWGPRWGHAETSDWEPRRLPDVKLGGSVRRISAGGWHTCALMESGSIRCWGVGGYGRLGYPGVIFVNEHGKMFRSTFVDDHGKSTPARMGDVDIGGQVIALSAGQEHTCAILDGGVVRCWGHGRFGKLGYADDKDIGEFEPPRAAGDVNVGGRVVAVEAGGFHTCAILDTGAVRCWGDGVDGQLGYGNKRVVGVTDVPAAAGDVPVF